MKNIYLLKGKPLISYAIRTALNSELFDSVIVSTDSPEIARIAQDFGADVPKLRSQELSDDFTTTYDVIADALGNDWTGKSKYDYACCIYATTPLLRVDHLRDSLEILEKHSCQYVFPAAPFKNSIFRSFIENDSGKLGMVFPEYLFTRTQDLPVAFHDVGQFYWGTTTAWKNKEPIFGENSRIYPVKSGEFIDIDTMEDIAELEQRFQTSQQY